jgi:hypothetical protein
MIIKCSVIYIKQVYRGAYREFKAAFIEDPQYHVKERFLFKPFQVFEFSKFHGLDFN